MLVVVRVDRGRDFRAVGSGCLGGVHAVGVEHAGQLDLQLVGSVEGEGVVEAVLVVGSGDDLRDDQLAITGGDDAAVAVVGVLVQKTVVLLVDTDGVLDDSRETLAGSHDGVHVVNGTLAVTSQLERVGHQTSSILTNVKCVLPVVRRIRVAVRNNHLDNADTVEECALTVLVVVLHADIGEDNTLAVVEANVHLVARPRDLVAVHAERNALGLGDVDGLERAVDVVLADKLRHVVMRGERNLCSLAIDIADIDGENLLLLCVHDNGKVQWVRILVVVRRGAVIHQTLLKTSLVAPALINTNGPSIDVDLGHVIEAKILTGLNDTGIRKRNTLANVEVLKGKCGTDLSDGLPQLNLAL